MKRTLIIVVLVAIAVVFSSCATGGEKANSSPAPSATATTESAANVEQEIRKIHQEYDRAWLQQDATAFDRLLADDVTQTDPEGKVLSKAEIVANAKSGDVKFEVGQSDDVKVRVYGNTALVTTRWTEKSTNKGKPTTGIMRNTVVYVKKNGNWQVVSDQVTPVTPQQPKP